MPSIAKAPFGHTGHLSTRVIFGAAVLARASEREAAETLELALEYGLNHVDTAAGYGASEDRLRPWLRDHRESVFLATKTGDRTAAPARESLLRSLERMDVASVDLIELHNLVHPANGRRRSARRGARGTRRSSRRGPDRFIGVTGHGLTAAWMHARALDRFPSDSALAPYSAVAMQGDQYAATSRPWPTPAPSAAWRCRRSRQSRSGRGGPGRTLPGPGTSRSRNRRTSTSLFTGCSGGKVSSSTPSATASCCARARRGSPLRAPARRRRAGGADRASRHDAAVRQLRDSGTERSRSSSPLGLEQRLRR